MPELPEVETIRLSLRPRLVGAAFAAPRVEWPKAIRIPTVERFCQELPGHSIQDIRRRGKYLIFDLTGRKHLIIHLMMTGALLYRCAGAATEPHVHTTLTFGDGSELRFRDTRKFGALWLVDDPAEIVGKLGPEPLDPRFTAQRLSERLARHVAAIKPVLLDQSVVAGLGNIYVDEALYEAGIHPERSAASLSADEVARLHRGIRRALRRGIAYRGTSFSNYRDPDDRRGDHQSVVRVFRRTGQPCTVCGTPVRRIVLRGRGTHLCPRCQPHGQVLPPLAIESLEGKLHSLP